MERYTVSMPLLPSALPPKGEASRYGANIFLNLIALPVAGYETLFSSRINAMVIRLGLRQGFAARLIHKLLRF